MFEDVLYALETAKSAGFITVGVEDSESINDRERIMRTADYYVTSFTPLISPLTLGGTTGGKEEHKI